MQEETDPDLAWVAALAGGSARSASRAIAEARGERRLFSHLTREHRREGRSSYIEIDAPLEVYALARLLRPQHVVEVGVSSGVSSAYLLQALKRNGRGSLHSIDRPTMPRPNGHRGGRAQPSWALPPGRFSGWAVPKGLSPRWDLRIGDKQDLVPFVAEQLPDIGLLVYDVPHDDVRSPAEFDRLDRRMRTGAVAIVDHGPGGGLCPALAAWAHARGAEPVGRSGLGLYGFRCARPRRRPVRGLAAA